jgi:hypothetical protein
VPVIATVGTILIKDNAILPETILFDTEPYIPGWNLLKNVDAYGLGRQIFATGWTFFCMAGEIRATAFGSDAPKGAIKRILARHASNQFNCLEITRVISKRFWGLPCVGVYGRYRHVQDNAFLFQVKRLQKLDLPTLVAA